MKQPLGDASSNTPSTSLFFFSIKATSYNIWELTCSFVSFKFIHTCLRSNFNPNLCQMYEKKGICPVKIYTLCIFEITPHVGMITSHNSCRFFGCTLMLKISCYTSSQRCSTVQVRIVGSGRPLQNTDLIVMFIEAGWEFCFVNECNITREVATQRWVNSGYKRVHMVSTIKPWHLSDDRLVLMSRYVPRSHPHNHYTNSTSQDVWRKAGWVHGFTLSVPNPDLTICVHQWKSRLIREGYEPVPITASA